MSRIVIVDLGTGNLRSVHKAVQHVATDSQVCVSAEPEAITSAEHLILPGQGALGVWMDQLNADTELRDSVRNRLQRGPVLGICLGLEALYAHSAENGGTPGLGIFQGSVKHFEKSSRSKFGKIPHMGWNRVRHTRDHPLWHGIDDQQRFYFAHSYFVDSEQQDEIVGECEYGDVFTAAVACDNLFATQFHPEKSNVAGLQLLRNFVQWNGKV